VGFKLLTAASASLAAVTVLGAARPAAAAAGITGVPCIPAALSAAITGAASNGTLSLAASCRYVLTTALPVISKNLIIAGNGATLERSAAPGTPRFAIISAISGNLTITQLSFRNGYGGAVSYQSGPAAGGSIAIAGGTFSDNTGGAINDDGSPDGALKVAGTRFSRNAGGAVNDGDESAGAGALTVTGAAFTRNTGGAITDFGNDSAGYDTVTGSTFTGNAGGGINYQSYVASRPSTLLVASSAFTRNTGSGINCATVQVCSLSVTRSAFTGNAGSGISTGPTNGEDDITVSRSSFTRNAAAPGGGIDLDSFSAGTLTATRDTFTGNTAAVGGGAIYNFDYVAATGSSFTGNSAPVGGGMENEWQADVTGSTFSKNTASSDGCGLYNDDQIAVSGTVFRRNTAGSGGAISQIPDSEDNNGQGTPALSLTSSKVAGNNALTSGGGISNTIVAGYSGPGPGPGTVTLAGSQVTGNQARTGGGIYNYGGGSVSLASSAVTGNKPDNCAPANAVPGCLSSSATKAPGHEPGPGGRAGSGRIHCVPDRLGLGVQTRDRRPGQCGVHYLAMGLRAGTPEPSERDASIQNHHERDLNEITKQPVPVHRPVCYAI
jgi:hypothetical protein